MEALTYSTVALTLGLVVARPKVGPRLRLSPAMAAVAGVLVLAMIGSVRFADVAWAAATMWRPLGAVVAIMTMTGVARRFGVLEGAADRVFERARGSSVRLFALVFVFGAATSALLNNDSAILLVTPLVVDAARRRAPRLLVPLAFAVFLSAGVAPFIVSNPMNMVVASYAGIGFNEYAARMLVPALAGSLTTFVMARVLFRRELAAEPLVAGETRARRTPSPHARIVLGALLAVVLAYPVVSWLGGPVWAVAAVGAALLLAIAAAAGHRPAEIVRAEVHWGTLLFLFAALVLSIGLRHVGVVDRLAAVYSESCTMRVGLVSALGSAVLNNHPMSNLNMFALGQTGAGHASVLAALVGGDLGPRLFPMGSLAGLLWLEMLRRAGIELPARRFVLVGAIATIPTLIVCLALL